MLNLKRLPTEDLHGTRQLTNSPISSEPASGVNGGGKVDHMGGSMKFQRHTLQLLPDRQRRSYAGAAVMVLHRLDGRLSLQHEGRIIAAQEAPPSPGSLRNGIKSLSQ